MHAALLLLSWARELRRSACRFTFSSLFSGVNLSVAYCTETRNPRMIGAFLQTQEHSIEMSPTITIGFFPRGKVTQMKIFQCKMERRKWCLTAQEVAVVSQFPTGQGLKNKLCVLSPDCDSWLENNLCMLRPGRDLGFKDQVFNPEYSPGLKTNCICWIPIKIWDSITNCMCWIRIKIQDWKTICVCWVQIGLQV